MGRPYGVFMVMESLERSGVVGYRSPGRRRGTQREIAVSPKPIVGVGLQETRWIGKGLLQVFVYQLGKARVVNGVASFANECQLK
jgi:hypothetical protein